MKYTEAKAVVDLLVETGLLPDRYRNNAMDLLMNEIVEDPTNGDYTLKEVNT